MIDAHSPQPIRQAYETARLEIERAKSRAQLDGAREELENIEWFERILDTASRLVGPQGMDLVQARAMFRTLNDCEPSSPPEVAKAIDAFAEAIMSDARTRTES